MPQSIYLSPDNQLDKQILCSNYMQRVTSQNVTKAEQNKKDAENYRPISLTNCKNSSKEFCPSAL